MTVTPRLRETRACVARVGLEHVRRGSRRSGRCGAAALDFGDVRVAGQLVVIPLCRAHFRTGESAAGRRAADLPRRVDSRRMRA